MTSQDIDIPIESINVLCRRYQVRELALFGSALGGSFGPDSDLDFLVEFQPEAQVGFMKLAKMQREFSAVLNRKVDLVPKGGLKPKIRQAIISSAEVLYASAQTDKTLQFGEIQSEPKPQGRYNGHQIVYLRLTAT